MRRKKSIEKISTGCVYGDAIGVYSVFLSVVYSVVYSVVLSVVYSVFLRGSGNPECYLRFSY